METVEVKMLRKTISELMDGQLVLNSRLKAQARELEAKNNLLNKALDRIVELDAKLQKIRLFNPPISVDRYFVFLQIHNTRKKQDDQWGGAKHDDTHDLYDWTRFILAQLSMSTVRGIRKTFINIAALAVAAVESYDRIGKTEMEKK